ncbi:MAG: cobalt ECF transporter T component CbiQ [Kiritimatiellales bacterium]|nr:cobalt ECF transporter T component CbiQ [Kiritimatiellales bacterium]
MKAARYIEVGQMDELGRLDTPLHRLDARVKMAAVVLFVVTVMSFPRYEISGLMPLFLFPFVLMGSGKIPFGAIFKKVALALPFALFVGLFNPLLDRTPVLTLGPWTISGGWLSFFSILLRFTLTVSAALILLACTGIYRLCAGLERLGVPPLFATQLLFLYRYLFVIGGEALRMIRSVRMRSAGSKKLSLRIYSTLTGHLLLRSIDRAQRIYRAMVSRGFDGQIRVLHRTRPGWRDLLFLIGWSAFFILVRFYNPAVALGGWLTGEH